MHNGREFDLVVYGASGFTGRLVAEYVSERYDGSLKWALAGRNEQKTRAVRDELGIPASVPVIAADADRPETLRALAGRTRAVITTVGPYQLYGEPLVAACAEAGTDYVDLCGEPAWMREMIDAYQETAKKNGARIVFSCGFDSIPFDLGVLFLQENACEKLGTPLPRVRGRVRSIQGSFSGGTAASLKATLAAAAADPKVRELLLDPFALTPGFSGPEQPLADEPQYAEELESWQAPFVMAPINTRNVHRSNLLLGHRYGRDFRYDEMLLTGPGEEGRQIAEAVAVDTSMTSDDGPKPGEGPSHEERENGFYDVLFIGETADGRVIRASVSADRDPGYGSTSRMITESAVCLIEDATDTPGGIWTTAPAMGNRLIDRLAGNAGLTFRVE